MSDQQRRGGDDARDDAGAADEAAWLAELLGSAAAAYEPDTERLRALVAERIGESPDGRAVDVHALGERAPTGHAAGGRRRPASPPPRTRRPLPLLARLGLAGIPAGAALAAIGAAAALAIGATATFAVTSNHDVPTMITVLTPNGPGSGRPSSAAATPTSQGAHSPTDGGTTGPASPTTHTSASAGAATTPTASSPAENGVTNALFSVSPSIDSSTNPSWTQLDVTVIAKVPLTTLTITVTVAPCPGLSYYSQYSNAPNSDFAASSVQNPDGSLTYTFALRPGATYNPSADGSLFAVQFKHATTGWNPALDAFTVDGRTVSSAEDYGIHGTFQP